MERRSNRLTPLRSKDQSRNSVPGAGRLEQNQPTLYEVSDAWRGVHRA